MEEGVKVVVISMVKVKTLDTANNYIVPADSLSNNVVIRIFRFVNYRLENCTAIYDFKVPSWLQFNCCLNPVFIWGYILRKVLIKLGTILDPTINVLPKKSRVTNHEESS